MCGIINDVWLAFAVGCFLGGVMGISLMCLLAIGRIDE